MKKSKRIFIFAIAICTTLLSLFVYISAKDDTEKTEKDKTKDDYIKWVDFKVSETAMRDALKIDIDTYGSENHVSWVELLSYIACKNGGDFSSYQTKQMTVLKQKLEEGQTLTELSKDMKLYPYYIKAYGAVLGGLVGEYEQNGERKYGLCAFSPVAKGFYYTHSDDFGVARSYGYKRKHLGHDMMGSVGTPIVAIEGGYVEQCGWNQYGGWRVGIRSFDGQRYYYYAHLRKDHPYNDIYEGKTVEAGEVIGYLGMTGYSAKENTNNINIPHLHFGLQLIFDPVQKDGTNQIWVDVYPLINFLSKYRSEVQFDSEKKEYYAINLPHRTDYPD